MCLIYRKEIYHMDYTPFQLRHCYWIPQLQCKSGRMWSAKVTLKKFYIYTVEIIINFISIAGMHWFDLNYFIFLKDLIPLHPEGGCINGAIDYKCAGSDYYGRQIDWRGCHSSCLCEEHCFWDGCYLEIPPEKCLSGTKSSWLWSAEDGFWIAQIQGKSFLSGRRPRLVERQWRKKGGLHD